VLYVGGQFTHVGALQVDGLVALSPPQGGLPMLDQAHWSPVGGGLVQQAPGAIHSAAGEVYSLVYAGHGLLVVGGGFTRLLAPLDPQGLPTAAPTPARNLVVWDAQTQAWMRIGDVAPPAGQAVTNAAVHALALSSGYLAVGGCFARVGDLQGPAPSMVQARNWALRSLQLGNSGAAAWTVPASSIGEGYADAIVSTGQGLFAGGLFAMSGLPGAQAAAMRPLLRWQDGQLGGVHIPLLLDPVSHDDTLDEDLPSVVDALSAGGDVLCAGGEFSHTAAGVVASNLECRDLEAAQDLYPGQGTRGPVYALRAYWQMDLNPP
jgi:hypothetical protein